MKTNPSVKFVVGLALLGLVWPAQGQFVAVNDHAKGPGTSPNATTYNMLDAETGTNGPLKNITTGAVLPVTLTISRSGIVQGDPSAGEPFAGTPMHAEFSGLVDFANSPVQNNVGFRTGGFITYKFSGLNPTKKYILLGGAVRGSTAFTNRWGLFSLNSAVSFTSAHSPGTLVTSEVPGEIAANQVALNGGANHTATTGDIFRWDEIDPGPDGIIELVCTRYAGTVPGGSSGTATTFGYAPTAVKLIEAVLTPVNIITQPQSQASTVGASVTFTVAATGFPIFYQWTKDGVNIPGKTGPSLQFPSVAAGDIGPAYRVIVSNQLGSQTSTVARIVVNSPPATILPFNQTWKYRIDGADLGVSWRQPGFNDATWLSGPGPLGVETAAIPEALRTTLTLTTGQLIYYFRTTFTLTENPSDFTLQVTNLLDDGAVFYLNGTELYRVAMGTGEPTATTTSTRTVGDAGFETIEVPTDLLVQGLNTLAVEAHQVNGTSSDIVMGTRWMALFPPPAPIVILTQPADQSVEETKQATFSVDVTGSEPRFQWYHDSTPIPGATRDTYIITNTLPTDAGNYQVSINNAFNEVLSRMAHLTIFPDTNAPTLLDADGSKTAVMVEVKFSEVVVPLQATNIANYTISSTVGDSVPVTKAYMTNRTTVVLLSTVSRLATKNYILRVSNVKDISSAGNVIIPNSGIPISTKLVLMPFTGFWDFTDPLPEFDPVDYGTAWRAPGFVPDPVYWGINADGSFANGLPDLPAPRNTSLSNSEAITAYFLSDFNYQGSPLGADILLQHVIDDGAVIYFNNRELLRINMPSGTILYDTPAAGNITQPTREEVQILANDLTFGVNALAVELHQDAPFSVDKAMGIELTARIDSLVTGPIVITSGPTSQTATENLATSFTVTGAGPQAFQWFVNNTAVPGATNPIFFIDPVPLNYNNATIKVEMTNTTGKVTSTNAVLKVLPDTQRPTLVSAFSDSALNNVVVTFTEVVNPASATLAANYFMTNAAGETISISSATMVNNKTVRLNTGALPRGGAVLVVNNVRDNAVTPNTIRPNSLVTVGFQGVLVAYGASWRYDQSNLDLESDWRFPEYVDTTWSTGVGILGIPMNEALPNDLDVATLLVRLTPGGVFITNSYFRHTFTLSGAVAGMVTARSVIDDGAIFYVNGTEVARVAMPSGAVTANTFATRQDEVTAAGHGVDVFTFDGSLFRNGNNVVAVEVHQGGFDSSDIIFGTEFELFVPSVAIHPPSDCPDLHAVFAAGKVRITWDASAGCTLQETSILPANPAAAVWLPVTVTTPGVYEATPSAQSPRKFYRLTQ